MSPETRFALIDDMLNLAASRLREASEHIRTAQLEGLVDASAVKRGKDTYSAVVRLRDDLASKSGDVLRAK